MWYKDPVHKAYVNRTLRARTQCKKVNQIQVVCGKPWVDILAYGGHGGVLGCRGDVGGKAPPLSHG